MKQLLTLLFALSTSLAWSDTIDYWHVSYNDSVIARYNEFSKDLVLRLSVDQIRETDSLRIHMGSCVDCPMCTYDLHVVSSLHRMIASQRLNIRRSDFVFSLWDFIHHDNNADGVFLFLYRPNFYDESGPGPAQQQQLRLKLIIE